MPECIRVFFSRFVALFRRGRLDQELEDELGFHVEMQIQENLRNGMSPENARCSALRSIGGLDQAKEKYREKRSLGFLEDFIRDLRYGLQMLRRNPGFAFAAVLTLALGIGANTAIFSIVNAVLLSPLPFKNPEQLIQIKADLKSIRITPYFSQPVFTDLQRHTQQISEIAAYNTEQSNLSGAETADRVSLGRVSASFFRILGVSPRIGHGFAEEELPGGGSAVVLSDSFWKGHLGGDPAILGSLLFLDGAGYMVAGILPASFDFPGEPAIDVWTLLLPQETDKFGQQRFVKLIGRLKQPSRLQIAREELDSIYQLVPRASKGHIVLENWQEEITREARLPLLLFLGTVGFILLIACTNVANLLLARSTAREREFVIRKSLGARKIRILRQILTESLLIASIGGILGFALTLWAMGALQALVSENFVRIPAIRIDLRMLGFTIAVTLLTSAIVSVIPALQISRISPGESLKESSRSSMGRAPHRIQKLFIILEVGLVVILLIGTGLLLKSLLLVQRIAPGYRTENTLRATVDLSLARYPTVRSQAAYFEEALALLKSIPGAESVGATASLPMGSISMSATGMKVEGIASTVPDDAQHRVSIAPVSARYFAVMGIPVLHGRAFTDSDREGYPGVAIVDSTFVRIYTSGQDPIGRRIRNAFQKSSWLTIVGIVGSVHQNSLEKEAEPHVYTSYLQPGPSLACMTIVMQCARDPMELAGPVQNALRNLDRDQPVFDVMTLEDSLSRSFNWRKTNSFLIGSFAGLALLLAAVGIYGVVSYSVSRRTHEVGIRLALGAQANSVLWMVVKEAMATCAIGLLLGIAGALTTTRVITSLLYGVSATDTLIFTASFLFVAAVVLLASYIPARKVATVDPARSLRYE